MAKNRFVKTETANFGRNIPSKRIGHTSRGDPKFRSEETETDFSFEFWLKLLEPLA